MDSKDILFLVDVQKGFLDNYHVKGFEEELQRLLDRNIFDIIIASRFHNFETSMYTKLLNCNGMMEPEDCALPAWLESRVDITAKKYRYGCISSSLLSRMRKLNDDKYPNRIFIAGLDTETCVYKTAMDFFDIQIRPVILAKYCTSSTGKDCHNAGLLALGSAIGEKQICRKEIFSKVDLNI